MTVIAVPGAAEPGSALRAFANEAGKGLALLWRRRAITITAIVLQGFMFLMIQFFIGGGHLVLPVLALTLPGLFAYTVAGAAAVQGSGGIAEEVNGGTLEQVHLAPARPSVLVGGRLAALAVEGLIPAVVLALAYGLLMAALTLRLASIGAVVHVFNMAVMFFGGMFVPITLFPHGIEIAARFVPTALGVEVLNTTLAGRGLHAAWADGTLPWLLAHAVALIGLGWTAYLSTLRHARREGGLAPR